MSTVDGERESTVADPLRARADRRLTAPVLVFVAIEILALGLFVGFGRDQWFYWDEWDLLAGRQLGSIDDLLRPWHEHWVAGPTLIYRTVYRFFGLHSYLPYQLLGVGVHLALAALLRVVMRRAGVHPWIATVTAGCFALFGTGKQNIAWGYQITFTGAVLLGLVHLLLADHDGPLDRRDAIGILAGVVALTFSGAGAVMIGVVALTVLVRRGWRMAAVHVVPPALCFGAWWLAYGRHNDYVQAKSRPGFVLRYTAGGVEATLSGLGQLPLTGYLLIGVLAIGLVLAWRRLGDREVRVLAAAPAALLLGGLVFLALAGWSRAWVQEAVGAPLSWAGRYLHVTAAMVLPALAVAIDAIARRSRPAGVVGLAILLVGVPGNLREIADRDPFERRQLGDPQLFLSVANDPLLLQVPDAVQPFPEDEQGLITVSWLRDERDAGRIPDRPDGIPTPTLREAQLRLSLEQVDEPIVTAPCVPGAGPIDRRLEQGQSITFSGGFAGVTLRVTSRAEGASPQSTVSYNSKDGPTLNVVAGPLDVRLEPVGTAQLCG